MANSYLTFSETTTPANQTKFTYSAWIKRSKLGADQTIFYNYKDASNYGYMYFRSGDDLRYFDRVGGGDTAIFVTTRKFRDTSAWYHLVLQVDTTQGTASNRLKFYVNGVQETLTETTYPNQNQALSLPREGTRTVGANNGGGNPFDGYMSHVAFVDSTAPAPTTFGETDSTSGIWKFKSPSGVTWGNTGFHLKFENSGALGTDSSGNSSTFTVNGNLKQALDTPSNVYATLNPLASLPNTGVSTFTNGNTTSQGTNGSYVNGGSTLMMSSGKWYAEMKYVATSADSRCFIGITKDVSEISRINQDAGSNNTLYRSNNGNKNIQGSDSSYANSWTTGDIIGIALDLDNEKLYVSKNGTWQNSSDPTSGASGTGAITGFTTPASTVNGGYFFFSGSDSNAQNNTVSWNFGNGFFGTTAITSAGSNGNGSLFEYDVPSGYYALNTKNINSYG